MSVLARSTVCTYNLLMTSIHCLAASLAIGLGAYRQNVWVDFCSIPVSFMHSSRIAVNILRPSVRIAARVEIMFVGQHHVFHLS